MTMRRLPILLAAVCILAGHDHAQAKTREQVVADAQAMLSITTWTATLNTHQFDTIPFQSHFSTGTSYYLWPYVYGGKETTGTTSNRINSGTSPGGRNLARNINNPENTNPVSTEALWTLSPCNPKTAPGTTIDCPAQHLAGIDCSGFACRALGEACIADINNTNTEKLALLSVKRSVKTDIQPGDLLIKPGVHVRVVASTTVAPSMVQVVEAYGSDIGYARWANVSIGQYGVYSPFPVFSETQPTADSMTDNPLPDIKLTIKSETNIIGSSIQLRIDGSTQAIESYPDGKEIRVSFSPEVALSSGQHVVNIYAKNTLDLEDSATWTFTVGDFRPYLSSVRAVQGGSAVYASQWTASGAGMKLGSSYPKEASSE
ncbi:MAG: hypothetical protein WC986_14830, partial [Elusimicrobiota bacterium]